MEGFIRVRHAKGPAHEFDISEAAWARNKRAFKVIDSTPVAVSRPATYATASSVEKKSVAKAAGKERP